MGFQGSDLHVLSEYLFESFKFIGAFGFACCDRVGQCGERIECGSGLIVFVGFGENFHRWVQIIVGDL